MRILGLILSLGLVLLASFNGGSPAFFIDIPSAIMVLGITLGILLFSGAKVSRMLRATFVSDLPAEEIRLAARDWARARTSAVAAGWIGFLIGFMILANLIDFPEKLNALAPALGLSLITVFYGTVLSYLICLPIQWRLEERTGG